MLKLSYAFLLMLILSACQPEEIDLDLPAFEPELVIEGYLERWQPIQVTVSQTVPYFNEPDNYPVVSNAEVNVYHNGERIALRYVGNSRYASDEIIPDWDADTNPWTLVVDMPDGRRATGTTRFLTPVNIDSLVQINETASKNRVKVYFRDRNGEQNFYRLRISNDRNDKIWSIETDDKQFPGQQASVVSGTKLRDDAYVTVALYHIGEGWFKYLSSVRQALSSSNNPLNEPTRIAGNIVGGIGVFTTLNVTYRNIQMR